MGRMYTVLALLAVGLLSSVVSAIVVTHDNFPAFTAEIPIGSTDNFANYRCYLAKRSTSDCGYFGVGKLHMRMDNGREYTCSGTPIGIRTILTAAHCLDGPDAGGAVDRNALTSTRFRIPGVTADYYGEPLSHPSYSGRVVDDADIAIVRLHTNLPSWVPLYKLASFAAVPTGAVVTHVGYGRTGDGRVGPSQPSTVQPNIARNVIDAVSGSRFTHDFDSASRNRMGAGPLRIFQSKPYDYLHAEGTVAGGDSGGPVLYNTLLDFRFRPLPVTPKLLPDENQVLGVASFGTDVDRNGRFANYGDTASFVFVGPFRGWIRALAPDVAVAGTVFHHALASPVAEPAGVASAGDPAVDAVPVPDADGDRVDDRADNCLAHANPEQQDADGDGFGKVCDGDLNNDGVTNTLDLNLYRLAHRSIVSDARYNAAADFNSDRAVNTLDLAHYGTLHRHPPGPSCCAGR